MKYRFALFGAASLILQSACAAGLPVLSDSSRPFSFAVLGDLHFSQPEYESRQIVQAIAEAAKEAQPPVAFVCQTGDLGHGEGAGHKQLDKAEMTAELAFAVTCVTQQFNAPLFMAVGNHDKHGGGSSYRETVLPLISRQLNAPVAQSYYAFRYGNACFVFLDYGDYKDTGTSMDYAAQRTFLKETMAQVRAGPDIKHVFAFGHYPLWPVVRPGFNNSRFTESVVSVLKHDPADAYFCGHTHNSGAWVRRVDGVPITQIKGVAMDKSTLLTPMEETRTLLIPREDLSYGWGTLSGPPNGFFLVSVDGPRVRVQFRSGREVLREFTWQEPGRITDTVTPPPRPSAGVTEADLRHIAAATLIFTPWTETSSDIGILLNGEKVGEARIESMPQWAAFASETRVAIPVEKLKGLRLDNEVSLENLGKTVFGVGNVRLEVKLANGTKAHTTVLDRFLFSADRAEVAALHLATYGFKIIPSPVTSTVKLGQPLGPMRLRFPPKAE